MELDEFNVLAAAVRDMPSPEKQLLKLKALLKQFEVQDIETAIGLTEHLDTTSSHRRSARRRKLPSTSFTS